MNRVFNYLRQGHWFRRVSKDGSISLGHNIMSVGRKLAHQQLEVKVHPEEYSYLCFNATGDIVAHCRPRKLTKEYLMGHVGTVFNLPFFQLALPFPGEAEQVIRLFRTIGVTT
jgi:hypothetical protein